VGQPRRPRSVRLFRRRTCRSPPTRRDLRGAGRPEATKVGGRDAAPAGPARIRLGCGKVRVHNGCLHILHFGHAYLLLRPRPRPTSSSGANSDDSSSGSRAPTGVRRPGARAHMPLALPFRSTWSSGRATRIPRSSARAVRAPTSGSREATTPQRVRPGSWSSLRRNGSSICPRLEGLSTTDMSGRPTSGGVRTLDARERRVSTDEGRLFCLDPGGPNRSSLPGPSRSRGLLHYFNSRAPFRRQTRG